MQVTLYVIHPSAKPKEDLWKVNKFNPISFKYTHFRYCFCCGQHKNFKYRYTMYVRKNMTSIFRNVNLTSYPRSVCYMGSR